MEDQREDQEMGEETAQQEQAGLTRLYHPDVAAMAGATIGTELGTFTVTEDGELEVPAAVAQNLLALGWRQQPVRPLSARARRELDKKQRAASERVERLRAQRAQHQEAKAAAGDTLKQLEVELSTGQGDAMAVARARADVDELSRAIAVAEAAIETAESDLAEVDKLVTGDDYRREVVRQTEASASLRKEIEERLLDLGIALYAPAAHLEHLAELIRKLKAEFPYTDPPASLTFADLVTSLCSAMRPDRREQDLGLARLYQLLSTIATGQRLNGPAPHSDWPSRFNITG